jgi:vacuolar-type H+-ATPase subunit H
MVKKQMKTDSNTAGKIPPLDEIRQAEARIASQILLARQEAESIKQSARNQARQIREQALLAGNRAGQTQYKLLIQETTQTVKRSVAEANAQSETIKNDGRRLIGEAAQWVLRVVLELEQEDHESRDGPN